jgi:O-antigen/teichoic acid export membrane protein
MTQPSRRRAARANFLGTGSTILISVVQAVLLMPLCVQLLGPRVYGAWLFATELFVWIQLLDFGIPNLMAQRIGTAIGKGDRDEGGRWFATGSALLLFLAGAVLVAGWLLAPFVAVWAQLPIDHVSSFIEGFRLGVAASVMILLFNMIVSLAWGVQRTAFVNVAAVAGAAVGLISSVVLLLEGWGLWALAVGLAARAAISFGVALLFLGSVVRTGELVFRPRRRMIKEIVSLAPPMAAANVGYVLANNSEIVIVTTLFGPVTALVYAVTRRAADGLRSVLDGVAWAVYGGFAHLVASDDQLRARSVLAEILSLRFAIACLAAAVYAAVNEGFVTLLFGAEHFGGAWITAAFAVQMIVAGQGFLINYLYRAAGRVREGSLWLAGEAVARVSAILFALKTVGVAAAPLSAAVTAGVAAVLTLRRLRNILPSTDESAGELTRPLAGLAVLMLGIAIGAQRLEPSWTTVIVTAGVISASGGIALFWLQPADSRARLLSGWIKT